MTIAARGARRPDTGARLAYLVQALLVGYALFEVLRIAARPGAEPALVALLGAALASLHFAVRSPWIAAVAYVLAAHAIPRYESGFDLLLASGALGWIVALGLSGWLGWIVREPRPLPQTWRHPIVAAVALYFAWLALSWIVAQAEGRVFTPYPRHDPILFVHGAILCLIAATTLHSARATWTLAGALCVAVASRLAVQSGTTLYLDSDAPVLAAMTLPVAVVGAIRLRHLGLRVAFASAAIAAAATVLLAHNRAAGIGALVAVLLLVRHTGRRWTIWLIAALACATAFALLGPLRGYADRFSVLWNPQARHATAGLDRATIASRLELWAATRSMVADHPWAGVGPGNAPQLIGRYAPSHEASPTHNSLLNVLAETGVPGAVLYVAIFAGAIFLLDRGARRGRGTWPGAAAIMLQASLGAFVAAAMFISRHDMALSYLLLGWSLAVFAAARSAAPIERALRA